MTADERTEDLASLAERLRLRLLIGAGMTLGCVTIAGYTGLGAALGMSDAPIILIVRPLPAQPDPTPGVRLPAQPDPTPAGPDVRLPAQLQP